MWNPWYSVNVQIEGDKVYPVFAFNRVFAFWTKVETVIKDDATNTTISVDDKDEAGKQEVSSEQNTTYILKIFFSFYNLNKEWIPVQTLDVDIKHDQKIYDIQLLIQNSNYLKDYGKENILINCKYKVDNTNTKKYQTYLEEKNRKDNYREEIKKLNE